MSGESWKWKTSRRRLNGNTRRKKLHIQRRGSRFNSSTCKEFTIEPTRSVQTDYMRFKIEPASMTDTSTEPVETNTTKPIPENIIKTDIWHIVTIKETSIEVPSTNQK